MQGFSRADWPLLKMSKDPILLAPLSDSHNVLLLHEALKSVRLSNAVRTPRPVKKNFYPLKVIVLISEISRAASQEGPLLPCHTHPDALRGMPTTSLSAYSRSSAVGLSQEKFSGTTGV